MMIVNYLRPMSLGVAFGLGCASLPAQARQFTPPVPQITAPVTIAVQ